MKLMVVPWKTMGLGFMVMPERQQAGFVFLIWSVVLIWGDWACLESECESEE